MAFYCIPLTLYLLFAGLACTYIQVKTSEEFRDITAILPIRRTQQCHPIVKMIIFHNIYDYTETHALYETDSTNISIVRIPKLGTWERKRKKHCHRVNEWQKRVFSSRRDLRLMTDKCCTKRVNEKVLMTV